MLGRLGAGGVSFRVLTAVEAGGAGEATAVNLASGEEERLAADLLVVQTGRVASPRLARGRLPVHLIGDCLAPRRITHALFEAQRLARMI